VGTRGIVGFIVDGAEKIAYNHFDSYPSYRGVKVLKWLTERVADTNGLGVEGLRLQASQLEVVTDDTPITAEAIEKCKAYTDTGVGGRVVNGEIVNSLSWYQLLRLTQGDPEAILTCGYMEDNSAFALDSLFCEWGYLIDLDRMVFQVYRGFMHGSPPKRGRWAGRPTAEEYRQEYLEHLEWCRANDRNPYMKPDAPEYYAVELIGEWPLSDLPDEATLLALEG
jgi:hypothetical protein